MSVAAFCEQRGLATSTLFAWKRRLTGAGVLFPDGFVEAKVVEALPPEIAEWKQEKPPGVIELELRDGGQRVVMLRRGFDAGLLREVLAALSGELR